MRYFVQSDKGILKYSFWDIAYAPEAGATSPMSNTSLYHVCVFIRLSKKRIKILIWNNPFGIPSTTEYILLEKFMKTPL